MCFFFGINWNKRNSDVSNKFFILIVPLFEARFGGCGVENLKTNPIQTPCFRSQALVQRISRKVLNYQPPCIVKLQVFTISLLYDILSLSLLSQAR